MRIVIVGGPRCGKTTRALSMRGQTVAHTDDLIPTHDWSAQSEEVARWFDRPGPWVIEGTAAVRALRKWLRANPTGRPCDEVQIMVEPKMELDRDQQSMLKSFYTIWNGIQAELLVRGVQMDIIS